MLSILSSIRNKPKGNVSKNTVSDELNHRKIPDPENRLQDIVSHLRFDWTNRPVSDLYLIAGIGDSFKPVRLHIRAESSNSCVIG